MNIVNLNFPLSLNPSFRGRAPYPAGPSPPFFAAVVAIPLKAFRVAHGLLSTVLAAILDAKDIDVDAMFRIAMLCTADYCQSRVE
jgi:hypothetical protein